MKQSGLAVVFVTASNREEADKITSVLLEQRKAACVNILPQVDSRFWWQGKIDTANEVLLIIKTKIQAIPEVIALVKKNHSYTVPEIIALPILMGNPDYLDWINDEVHE
jgi:periplasmic divalent cation tolerance protein